jgi:hypothetical protein
MVQAMVAERFKVKLSHSSVGRLLHQLGLSAQRPLWRAYQQSPEAVKQWLETEYPAIRQRAQREGVQIFFADEAGVRSDFHSGTTWSPRGHTPVVSSRCALWRPSDLCDQRSRTTPLHSDARPGYGGTSFSDD